MRGRIWGIATATALLGIAAAGVGAASSSGKPTSGPLAFTLPATGPGSIPIGTDVKGHDWSLGGFSALAPIGASGKEYWALTDRGPNGDSSAALCGGTNPSPSGGVVFLPGFNPEIDKIGLSNGEIKVQERIFLHDGAHPASGKPTLAFDGPFYKQTATVCTSVGTDPFGVDTEGVVVDPRDGSFWVSDEYRPSILHVAGDGEILSRIVPADITVGSLVLDTATQYANALPGDASIAVQPEFPGIVNAFRKNRGFEGLAQSPDGQTLYTLVQSPLDYDTFGVGSTARNKARARPVIRVFKFDISDPSAPELTAEWVYLMARGYPAAGSTTAPPGADRISDVLWLDDDVLAIQERDDGINPTAETHYYRADFSHATDINGLAAANGTTASTILEALDAFPSTITPAATSTVTPRSPYIDVDGLLAGVPAAAGGPFINTKMEGGSLLRARGANPGLFATVNDNDFDLVHVTAGPAESLPTQLDLFLAP